MFTFSNGNKVNVPFSKCTNNKTVDLDFLVNNTRFNQNQSTVLEIRKIAKDGFDNNVDLERLKKDLRHLKLKLSYFLFSGICKRHHSDNSLDYNSFIQLDIDFKYRGGDYYSKLTKYKLARFPFVVMASLSPTGYGVRVLVKTSNYDKSKHLEASKQVIKYVSKELNVDIKNFDVLGASQPSFETYDNELYFNNNFSDFEIDIKELEKSELSKSKCDVRATDKTVFDIAKRYAVNQTGNGFEDGNKYLFINRFSIACNLLGVPFPTAKEYILSNYYHSDFANEKSNALSSPYLAYKDVFGEWSYKVSELKKSFNIRLNSPLGSRLKDVLEQNKLDNLKNCIIISGTGTGKTYWISGLTHKRIIVVPTIKMVEQVKAKYKAVPFHSKEKGDIIHANYIVTTYSSFHYVSTILENHNLINEFACYIDEFHNLTTSTSKSFQLKELNLLVECLPKYKFWIGVTGTDIYNFHPYFTGVKKYIINIPKTEKKLTLIDAKQPLKTLCECLKTSINRGRFPLVLYNNTSNTGGLHTVKSLLKDVPNVAYFNSKAKNNQFFRELSKLSMIHPTIKAVVSTTVIKEGNDILNDYDFDIIIYGDFHPTEIEQFANRPRTPKSISVCIIRTQKDDEKEQPKSYKFNAFRYAKFLERQCKSRMLELNNYKPYCYEDELLLEKKAYNYIHSLPLRNNGLKYEFDWLNFNYDVFRQETKYINNNDTHLIDYLSKFNIVFDKKLTSKDEIDRYLAIELKKQKQAVKRSNKKVYGELVAKVSQMEQAMTELKAFEIDTSDMPKIDKSVYKRYVKLRDSYVSHDSIIEILQDVGLSKAKFNNIVKQLTIYHLKNSDDYMKSNRRFSIVLQAVYSMFGGGETLTIEVIKERLKRVLSIDKSLDITKFDSDTRNDKTLKTIRLFFEVKKVRKRSPLDSKKWICEYSIKSLEFDVDFDNKFWNTHYSNDYMKLILSDVVN